MPKMKTNKSAAKRFDVTGNGKIKRRKAGLRHLLEKRSHGRKKKAGKASLVHQSDVKRISKTIPYAF